MNKKYAVIVTVIVLALLVGYFLLSRGAPKPIEDNSSKRIVLYTTTSDYVGGPCGYISFTSNGDRTEKCIDEDSAAKAADQLKTENPDIDILNDLSIMKIEADVHEVIESRSPSTQIPQPRDKTIIVIDKIYSVSPTDLED